MAVSDIDPIEKEKVADGVQVRFDFGFPILLTTDIEVRFNGVEQEAAKGGATYTVFIDTRVSGHVIFDVPPPVNTRVQIRRATVYERPVDYLENGDIIADSINRDFDRLWLCLQEQRAASDGSLSRPVGETFWEGNGWPIKHVGSDTADDSVVINSQLKTAATNVHGYMLAAEVAADNALASQQTAQRAAALAVADTQAQIAPVVSQIQTMRDNAQLAEKGAQLAETGAKNAATQAAQNTVTQLASYVTAAQTAANKAGADANAQIAPSLAAAAASAKAAAQSEAAAAQSEANAADAARQAANNATAAANNQIAPSVALAVAAQTAAEAAAAKAATDAQSQIAPQVSAAVTAKNAAEAAAAKAAADATAAANAQIAPSLAAAAASAQAAAQSETAASTSETNAAAEARAAAASAAAAAASATAAAASATDSDADADRAEAAAAAAAASAATAASANPAAAFQIANLLSEIAPADRATARANLGVVDAPPVDLSTALLKAENLAGLADAAAARLNLGLGMISAPSSGGVRSTVIAAPNGSSEFFIKPASGGWGVELSNGTPVPLGMAYGGTGASDLAGARAALGIVDPTPVDTSTFLLKADNLAGLADVPASRTALGVMSAAEVTQAIEDATKKLGSGGYIGEAFWHPHRAALPAGCVAADGQLLNADTYPDLEKAITDNKLPVTAEAIWQQDPSKRGCYVWGLGPRTIRIPDYNGATKEHTGPGGIIAYPASYPAPFMRGDSGVMTTGSILQANLPNIVGKFTGVYGEKAGLFEPTATGPFTTSGINGKPAKLTAAGINASSTVTSYQSQVNFDAHDANEAYGRDGTDDVYPNSITGCYVIRVATEAQTGGTVDVLSLQSDFESLRNAAEATNSQIGYAVVDFGTIAISQRYVKPNPFGNNTPVIVQVEVQGGGYWYNPGWIWDATGTQSWGAVGSYVEGEGIVVQTGKIQVSNDGVNTGAAHDAGMTSAPCRVHVWSIGKDISKLKQISQIDPALVAEFKAPAQPTGVREIWHFGTVETGVKGSTLTLSESCLGKDIYVYVTDTSAAKSWISSGIKIPGARPPRLPAIASAPAEDFEVYWDITPAMGYRVRVSDGGKTLHLSDSSSGAMNINTIYVDDYTPQP